MVNQYIIPDAKGLYSAVFIQYIIYGFLYCIEGAKLEEIQQREMEKKARHQGLEQSYDSRYESNSRVPETEAKL